MLPRDCVPASRRAWARAAAAFGAQIGPLDRFDRLRRSRLTPVDQFLWSSHIELFGGFARP